MMKKCFATAVCLMAALNLAGASDKPPETPRVVPQGTDPRLLSAITKANTDFNVAMTKGDVTPIVEPYTQDAVFVSIDGTVFRGLAEIRQLYRDRFAKGPPVLESKIESEELMLDADLAYERGRGAFTRVVDGKRREDWARFLTIWQRQPGGDWKVVRNIVLPDR
jgi:ketosteroid isomerase-like protein